MKPQRATTLIVFLSGLLFQSTTFATQTTKDLSQPTSRTARSVLGWKVMVDDRLQNSDPSQVSTPNSELGDTAIRFLEAKLFEIAVVVPPNRLRQLQQVVIVLDLNCGNLRSMQYHPSAGWLVANGYPADLEKCVHLPRAADVATKRNINQQPWVILHELTHAYHDQVLGFDDARILAAYERYKRSGAGDKAMLYDGSIVKHYALTDHKEFFAEMTEAFFGTNDFYPFNRAELKQMDPSLDRVLDEIWHE
jgi:hypothetical protein